MAKKSNVSEKLKVAEELRLRALADYQNLEKRVAQQQQQFVRFSTAAFITKLLPVVDHLERASKHLNDRGIQMIVKQLEDILESEEVKVIEVLGKPFDHLTMECVDQADGEKDKVIEVVENGYMIGDQVLRPAKVRVGKGVEVEKVQNLPQSGIPTNGTNDKDQTNINDQNPNN